MTAVLSHRGKVQNKALFPLPLRLALRDLRGGFAGFTIFLICIALGTGAIGAINSLSAALQDAIVRDGKVLLGGDVEATLVHRQATSAEREFLASFGTVSEVATLRAMARKPDGSGQALVDLKAVDHAYPLYGSVGLADGHTLKDAVQAQDGIAIERSLLDQLQIGVGDRLDIGRATLPVTAIIEQEPDRLAAGPALGSRILLSLDALAKTGLIEPGSLVRWNYRIKTAKQPAAPLKDALAAKFPEAGFLVRDSHDPSPGVSTMLKRLTEFLTLVGLTAMLTGGIGVANAVAAFIERRRMTIATYKAVGAGQSLIFRTLFIEIGLLAASGIAIGLAIAAILPLLSANLVKGLLPIAIEPRLYWEALGVAVLFGALTAFPFIIWPLGRSHRVRPAELFRGSGAEDISTLPPFAYRAASAAIIVALCLSAVLLSQEKKIAAVTCVALFFIFAFFWAVGSLIRRLAPNARRSRRPEIALALANIGGPASLTRTVALSLGAGLTLLTTVSLIDASLTEELRTRLPEHAPSYFFIGIPKHELQAFEGLLKKNGPEAKIAAAPMLRGRLVALRGVPVEKVKAPSNAEWVLNGDRGLTYSESLPRGSRVVEGSWWPADYGGEPLVSFETDIGKALGLKIGDLVTVNVLGRNLTARIANFRTVKWGSIDINFVMIFSPNALRQAPFSYLATLSWAEGQKDGAKDEPAMLKAVAAAFPTVSAIRVSDALNAINGIFEKVMTAVELAGSVTLVMGGLVVAGALITAHRRRIYEAVVLRTLGASKGRIVGAHILEYLILAASLSLVAGILALLAAYLVVTFIMDIGFTASLKALLQPSLGETIFVVALGAVGTIRVLSAKPAHYLRSE